MSDFIPTVINNEFSDDVDPPYVPSSNKKKQSKTGKLVTNPKSMSKRRAVLEQDEKDKKVLCELENEGDELSRESQQLKQDLEEMQNAWINLVIQGKIRFVGPTNSSTASSPQYSTSSGFSSPSTTPLRSTPSPGHITSYIESYKGDEPFDNLLDGVDVEDGDAFASLESIIVDEDAQKFGYPQD